MTTAKLGKLNPGENLKIRTLLAQFQGNRRGFINQTEQRLRSFGLNETRQENKTFFMGIPLEEEADGSGAEERHRPAAAVEHAFEFKLDSDFGSALPTAAPDSEAACRSSAVAAFLRLTERLWILEVRA